MSFFCLFLVHSSFYEKVLIVLEIKSFLKLLYLFVHWLLLFLFERFLLISAGTSDALSL